MFVLKDASRLLQAQRTISDSPPIPQANGTITKQQFITNDSSTSVQQQTHTTNTMSGNSAESNPGNFANRPKEEVKAIASKGGKASHGGRGKDYGEGEDQGGDETTTSTQDAKSEESHPPGRNPDGTFTKGSQAAAEAGHKGGKHSHDND